MKKLFKKWFGQKEVETKIANEEVKLKTEISDFQIEGLIKNGNTEEFFKVAKEIGAEKIKCNSNPDELASIHWAAGTGNIEIVKYLLSQEVKENPSLTRGNNFTPLHAASMHGFSEVVTILINEGADVNIQTDPQKYAPIHSASFGGHLETINILVKNGAEINLKNYRDELPIDTAKRQNRIETIEYFEKIK